MKSKVVERILSETPQEIKDAARDYANEIVSIKRKRMKNKTPEQLAKEYRKTTPNQMHGDELGFIAGFSAKEEIIKETLQTLEQLRDDINKLPLVEQIFKSRDLDRINNKIEVIQSLL